MRLLLVTPYMPPHEGGIERIAEDHAQAAVAGGWEVTWLASRVPPTASAEESADGVRRIRVPCWNGLETRLGVPVPLWSPGARGLVRRLVAESDLVHAHDVLQTGTSLVLGAARAAAKPALVTQHVGFVPYPSRVLRAIERVAYATRGRRNTGRATAVAHYNPGVLAWLERACDLRRPAVFLPNPVDGERFRPASAEEKRELRIRHRLPEATPIVLFVGRLVPKKGVEVLVAAAEPGYHLLLVGERGEGAMPVRPGIELRGFVPRDELAELLRAADVLALPSRGEGFPLVAQEAMASGLAVVLGDDPAYAGQVDDGAALFVPPAPDAVRLALRRLAASPGERAAIGARARASALRHWGRDACRARLLEVYAALARGEALADAGRDT